MHKSTREFAGIVAEAKSLLGFIDNSPANAAAFMLHDVGIWEPTDEASAIYHLPEAPDLTLVEPVSDLVHFSSRGGTVVNDDSILDELAQAGKDIVTQRQYRHFKGAHYIVDGLGIWLPNQQPAVLYRPVYIPSLIFIRPADVFLDVVEDNDYSVNRFQLIE